MNDQEAYELAKMVSQQLALIAVRRLLSEHQIQLKGIMIPIRIRVYHELKPRVPDYPFSYEQSHYLHPPTQAEPIVPAMPIFPSEDSAVRQAIGDLTEYFEEAIRHGHEPSDAWLVPNRWFEHGQL